MPTTRRRRTPVALLSALAALVLLSPPPAAAQVEPLDLDRGATGLGLALRQVGTSGRVLYVTAHPDDESNGVLVRLARGQGLRTMLLSLTRGEGGQNAIGPELFEALGVLRTGELMAMHRYDGVEQRFGLPWEFGFSFSVEETLEKWGREETLGDIVLVIREFRPDVILTLPLESPGGGQHHQAVAQLTREAFRVAADPARFPEQIQAGLAPWQALKLYQGGTGGYPLDLPGEPVSVPTGVYDPLLGMTWNTLGSRARSLHRCQGVGQIAADPGAARGLYFLVDSAHPVENPEGDILAGLDTTLVGLTRFAPGLTGSLTALQEKADAARAAFDPHDLATAAPPLAEALAELRRLRLRVPDEVADPRARAELDGRLGDEERDLERALVRAWPLVVEAFAEDGLVVPGQTVGVSVSAWNEGPGTVELDAVVLDVPRGWTVDQVEGQAGSVEGAGARHLKFEVNVGPDARPSQPYWRRPAGADRQVLDVPRDRSLPWSPPAIVARVTCRIEGAELTLSTPAVLRYPGPFVGGEKRHVVQVVPELSVRVSPERAVVPREGPTEPLEVRVFVRHAAPGPGDATVRLEAPGGWSVEPAAVPLRFSYEGEEIGARFRVTPPASVVEGDFALRAVAVREGRSYDQTVQEIAYDHVQRRQRLVAAEVRVLALDVRTAPGVSVGYVMGSGDALADAIRQLGVPVTLLEPEDLAFGDLSRFTTIVTGIRAYETREDLRSMHPRLMRWVEAGGHLVVQYNRAAFNTLSPHRPGGDDETSPFTPYPAVTTRERITDEAAPLQVLVPEHPFFTTPNRIGEGDWEGWVQERGTYFLEARDPRYVELLCGEDPFPKNAGVKAGILVDVEVGEGTWTYVGLVLFRQVPEGVPGGWRLLANLVSR